MKKVIGVLSVFFIFVATQSHAMLSMELKGGVTSAPKLTGDASVGINFDLFKATKYLKFFAPGAELGFIYWDKKSKFPSNYSSKGYGLPVLANIRIMFMQPEEYTISPYVTGGFGMMLNIMDNFSEKFQDSPIFITGLRGFWQFLRVKETKVFPTFMWQVTGGFIVKIWKGSPVQFNIEGGYRGATHKYNDPIIALQITSGTLAIPIPVKMNKNLSFDGWCVRAGLRFPFYN